MTGTSNEDYTAIVLTIDGDEPEAVMVELLGRRLPDELGAGRWFAVPMSERTIEVGIARTGAMSLGDLGPPVMTEETGRPVVLDPTRLPNGELWEGFASLLCEATRVAASLLAGRESFHPVLDDRLARLLLSLADAAAPGSADAVLEAAREWLLRVLARRIDDVSSDGPALEPNIVAGARAVHLHVVQLCGADPSVDRLEREVELIGRAKHARPG